MATHPTAIRNIIANAVVDRVDLGTGTASGRLILMTSANATVATLVLSNPAFGDAANGVATANAITPDTNTVGGTVDKYKVVDRDGTTIYEGPISEIAISNPTFGAGQTATCSTLQYVAAN